MAANRCDIKRAALHLATTTLQRGQFAQAQIPYMHLWWNVAIRTSAATFGACEGGRAVLAEALLALATLAGNTVVAAATTDAWEAARHKLSRLLGRGDPKRAQTAGRWLDETQQRLTASSSGETERVRAAEMQRWIGRFADLLDEDPGTAGELQATIDQIRAALPATVVQASDHSIAGNVSISAPGGIAAGVWHGDMAPPGPSAPGRTMG
jgi:hypothetical protein